MLLAPGIGSSRLVGDKQATFLQIAGDDGFRMRRHPGANRFPIRITDRAHILETGTESYRFRRTAEKQKKGAKTH
jgi:hypothetical protein